MPRLTSAVTPVTSCTNPRTLDESAGSGAASGRAGRPPRVSAPKVPVLVTVTGTIRDDDGRLAIHASSVEQIAEPKDPYEY